MMVNDVKYGIFWRHHVRAEGAVGPWGEYCTDSGYPWLKPGLDNGRHSMRYANREDALRSLLDTQRIFKTDTRLQNVDLVVGKIDSVIEFETVSEDEELAVRFNTAIKKLQPEELQDIMLYIERQK